MQQRKPQDIKPGDQIYVETRAYISHGEDDVIGGLATVVRGHHDPSAFSEYVVEVAEHPGCMYNLTYLLEKQDELRDQFGEQRACPDRDLR
ncbi:MAG: hypothetical protein LAN62_06130 [Acidobacteriia bacterium]|nr:hypothetical protein [Terriglobia bacterium]